MSKSLKQICDIVSVRSGLGKMSHYFNSNDETLAYLANEAVHELMQHPWQALRTAHTITMTTATTYNLPDDLAYIVSDTMNADGQERYIKFPTSDANFWYHKTHSPSGIRYKIRMYQGQLEVLNPDSGVELKFEYISNYCVNLTGNGNNTRAEFTKDTDVWSLDDELLIKDLKWRYKAEKGVEGWEKDKMIFNEYKAKLIGQEVGASSLDFSGAGDHINPEPYTDLYV